MYDLKLSSIVMRSCNFKESVFIRLLLVFLQDTDTCFQQGKAKDDFTLHVCP